VPKHLRQLAQITAGNGLNWTAADYRVNPETLSQAASLEVRTTLKGPYPRLRATIAQTLRDIPATTLREFRLTRISSESIDVEAQLLIAVVLSSEAGQASPSRAQVSR
jgi:hypothetical protein